ncbi:MAG: TonB-dependent receptor [Balneolaceae bacterium]|nr:TonB-dependent receptor [Balneolaceae bacterium]
MVINSIRKLALCGFFLGVLFTLLPSQIYAQTRSTLRVLVISEEDGNPIIGANVILFRKSGTMYKAGATNADGLWEFINVNNGTYDLAISSIGFEKHEAEITLAPGETRLYRTELPTANSELGEVIVSGTRSGAVQRVAGKQSISVTDIQLIPAPGPGGDLSVYLQTLPGVVTSGDRGGELFIRGGTPAQNLILVDKMPVIKPFHISNLFSAFPQSVISNVDLYAGGFGAEYEGATSSVMDVSLRQGNMRQFQSQVAASPYIISALAEGPLETDKQSLLVMGRYSVIEQAGPSLTGEDVPLKFSDIMARYSINWDGFTCNMTALHTYDRGKINPQRNISLGWENTAVGARCLGYSEELKNSVDFTIGYSSYKSSEIGFDDLGRTSNISIGYLRMDNTGTAFDHPYNYGFRWNLNFYKANLDEPFPEITGKPQRFGLGATLEEYTSVFSTYLSTEFKPTNTLSITPGITTQIRQENVSMTFEPRFRMTWKPLGTDNQELSFAVGKYVQLREAITDERDAGTVFYVYKPVGVDEPVPTAIHAITGYRQRIGDFIEANIETYYKHNDNVPVAEWTREPGNTIRTAFATAETYGLDLQLQLKTDLLYLTLGYGLAEVEYSASADDLVAWIETDEFVYNPSHDRRHQLNILASYKIGKFTANAIWRYSSGAPYTKLYAIDLIVRVPYQDPLQNQGKAVTLYSVPFDGNLPAFQRLDVSIDRKFQLSPKLELETEIGAINSYDMTNVFYFDVNTLRQVNELPMLPYASISLNIN